MYEDIVVNNPEKFGLTIISYISGGDPYSFNDIYLLKHKNGRLFWCADSGYSCPIPFEYFTSLEDLWPLNSKTWNEFEDQVMNHYDASAYKKIEMLNAARKELPERG